MSLLSMPNEIIIYIASLDYEVLIKLTKCDRQISEILSQIDTTDKIRIMNSSIICIVDSITITWLLRFEQRAIIHRNDDLPAKVFKNGTRYWYQRGLLHRDNDMPAIIRSNGDKCWYQHGLLHRDNDMPAIMHKNGARFWYQRDKLHRDNNLPAKMYTNGYMQWYTNGELCN